MDEFLQLNWGIKEPHELDYGPSFIPDNEISKSYIYSGIDLKESNENQNEVEINSVVREKQIVPGHKYFFKSQIRSFLKTHEHEKCLVALRLLQANKKTTGIYEQHCMELYNNSLQGILKENAKFLEFAKQEFSKRKKKMFKLKNFLKRYATSVWEHKLNRSKDYAEFYKGMDILPYSYKEDEEPVEMTHVQNILELGALAKYSGPTLLKTYHLKQKVPKIKEIYNSNQPVSKDQNIDKLVEMNNIDVAISSSGLKKLMNFTKTNTEWDIPIVIKVCNVQNKHGISITKNIVFIDKPLPNKSPSELELNEQCFKILLKTNFCDTEALRFQNTETPIDICDINTERKTKTDIIESPALSSGKRKLEEENEIIQDNTSKVNGAEKENSVKVHHNVSYRVWSLQLKNEQCELIKTKSRVSNIRVLVRTKLDGCESLESGVLQPVNVIPKLEYHLEYGASLPTKDELFKEWISAYFRPFSQVRRVRTHYNTGEIISIENCNTQKIAYEAQTNYQNNMHLGFGVLYKIFSRLTNLLPGNYLLHYLPKDGTFVQLLQATEQIDNGTLNLHQEYNINKCTINTNAIMVWHPIDINYILPRHNAIQQMPGMFKPSLPAPKFTNTKKKKKKKNRAKYIKGRVIKQYVSVEKK